MAMDTDILVSRIYYINQFVIIKVLYEKTLSLLRKWKPELTLPFWRIFFRNPAVYDAKAEKFPNWVSSFLTSALACSSTPSASCLRWLRRYRYGL